MKIRPGTALAAGLVVPCGLLGLLIWDRPDFLISSDTLLPAAFVWDMLHVGGAWSGFQQPRVPSFVPDLLIFGIVQAVTGSWRVAMAVWVSLILGWLVMIASWIATRLARSSSEASTFAFLLLLIPLLTAAVLGFPRFVTDADRDGYAFPALFILMPYSHGGPFLLALTAAALASRATQNPKLSNVTGLGILSCAAVSSDLLSVATLLLPLTMALQCGVVVKTVPWRTAFRLLSASWCGGAIGWIGTRMLDLQPMRLGSFAAIPDHIILFAAELSSHPGIVITLAGLAAFLVIDASRRGWRLWLGGFWPVFAAVSALGSLGVTMLRYEDVWSFRYAIPLIWWVVILAAAALAGSDRARQIWPRIVVVIITAGLGLICIADGLHVPRLFDWNLPLAACLRTEGLSTGLAEYWNARKASAASDWRIDVEQIMPDGSAMLWGNDRRWFSQDIHDSTRRPMYRFIVMGGLEAGKIVAVFGKPDRVVTCASEIVWVYDDAQQLYENLVRATASTGSSHDLYRNSR